MDNLASGSFTFLRSKAVCLNDLRQGSICVAGAPFGSTVTSRKGAHLGPDSIRESSDSFYEAYNYIKDPAIHDNLFNEEVYFNPHFICDIGNINIYPEDIAMTMDSIYESVAGIISMKCLPLVLGGDHTITIPAFKAFLEMNSHKKVGYIHIDNHMDFGDNSETFGKFYRGSTAKRIWEYLGRDYRKIVWIGQGDFTSYGKYREIKDNCGNIYTLYDIRNKGIEDVAASIIATMREYDSIYVSVDVDVMDPCYAPGVGGPALSGMSPGELAKLLSEIFKLNIGALDVVELAPNCDPGGLTSYLVSQVLFKTIFRLELK